MPLAAPPLSASHQPPAAPAHAPACASPLALFLSFYDLILSLLSALSLGRVAPALVHPLSNCARLFSPFIPHPLTHPFYRFCRLLDRLDSASSRAGRLKPPPPDSVPDPRIYVALCAQAQLECERLGEGMIDYAALAAQCAPLSSPGPRTSSSATPATHAIPVSHSLITLLYSPSQSPCIPSVYSVHFVHHVHHVHLAPSHDAFLIPLSKAPP